MLSRARRPLLSFVRRLRALGCEVLRGSRPPVGGEEHLGAACAGAFLWLGGRLERGIIGGRYRFDCGDLFRHAEHVCDLEFDLYFFLVFV